MFFKWVNRHRAMLHAIQLIIEKGCTIDEATDYVLGELGVRRKYISGTYEAMKPEQKERWRREIKNRLKNKAHPYFEKLSG